VEECVSAFKLELPDELMAAIDVIHEQSAWLDLT
jgi:hypothetical protein